jgi:3,4-dihydroxy 2-butanone 4-phosphate synthase/GTP cyclohydrolase II
MEEISATGGVLVYLRGQEGRGIGLAPKLRTYELQDFGRDTVDANLDLGLPIDGRSYGEAGQILRDLGVLTTRLISNNPDKQSGLIEAGIAVTERLPTETFPTPYNRHYLQTKRDRMGHQLPDLGIATEPTAKGE